jgi:uncharacterized protein (UPF0305 family)
MVQDFAMVWRFLKMDAKFKKPNERNENIEKSRRT